MHIHFHDFSRPGNQIFTHSVTFPGFPQLWELCCIMDKD